jgi:hypothetical protein
MKAPVAFCPATVGRTQLSLMVTLAWVTELLEALSTLLLGTAVCAWTVPDRSHGDNAMTSELIANFIINFILNFQKKSTAKLMAKPKAPSPSSEVSTTFQEIKGGPREGSGGAVSEATSAAATGCKRWAKGLTFSSPTEREAAGSTTGAHKGQSMLVVAWASTPSSPEATIFMPPALEQTI